MLNEPFFKGISRNFNLSSRKICGVVGKAMSIQRLCALIIISTLYVNSSSYAADVTFVSGIYQKSSDKVEGSSAGSTSTLSLGGRFSDDLTTETAWVAEGDLRLISYSAAAGTPSPDNAMGLKIGGGSRYYFKPIIEAVVPYATAIVTLKNEKELNWLVGGYKEISKSGLYYGANAGIRAGLGNNFFVELEFDFFESPLFAVTKTEQVTNSGGARVTSKNETTESSIFAKSSVNFNQAKVGVGMLL